MKLVSGFRSLVPGAWPLVPGPVTVRRAAASVRAAGIAAIALLALGLSTTAGAQTLFIAPNDPRPSYGWTVTPVFVFSQSTDSNVTLANKDTANTSDSVAGLSPSGEVGYSSALTSMTAGYAGSALRYWNLSQLDTFDQRLYGNFKQAVTRHVQLFAQASAGWMPTTDTVLLAGIPFARVGSRIKTLEAGGSFALARHTTISAGYRLEYVSFDQSNPLSSQLFGGHSNGVYGDLRQQVSPHVTIGAAWDIRRATLPGAQQQFDMENGEGTIEYRFSPVLAVSGGFGIARIAGTLPGEGTRVGPSWHAGINYNIQRALAYATYLRSYVPSYAIGGTIQNEELDGGVRLPVAFRDRLWIGGSVAWRNDDPLLLVGRRLTSLWFNANAGYEFAPWLRLEGFYARSSQDAHFVGGVVDRNQLGVQVVTLAPMRFK